MTGTPSTLPELIAAAKRYARDPSRPRDARAAVAQVRELDSQTLKQLVDQLRRSTDPADRGLAALVATGLPAHEAAEALIAAVDHETDPVVLAAAAEALRDLEGA